MAGSLVSVTATLHGLAHAAPVDLDVMMSGPGAKNVVLMSDAGGTDAVSGVDVTFDDAAAGAVPTPVADGTFRPTDDDSDGPDAFPAPAPVPSTATLSTFQGGVVNGTWSLWVVDDASGDSGSIGRWCVTITTTSMLATTVVGAPNPSVVGETVTFTATTTADGLWVHAGTIQFASDGSNLGAPVPVGPDGKATFSTSVLTAGSHSVTATYLVNPTYPTSSGTTSQVVGAAPAAEADGPYSVAEGGSLTLAGSVAPADPAATYTWDVNGDGTFGDATGATPTLTWAQLEALGIDDGPSSHVITLRVTSGAQAVTDTASLQVTNLGPITVVSYQIDVRVGLPSTFELRAGDFSSADLAGLFTYVVDWGDGSPLQTVTGPSSPAGRAHVYGTRPLPGLLQRDGQGRRDRRRDRNGDRGRRTHDHHDDGAAEHHHDRDRATDLDDDVHNVDDDLVVHLARFHLDTGDERFGRRWRRPGRTPG